MANSGFHPFTRPSRSRKCMSGLLMRKLASNHPSTWAGGVSWICFKRNNEPSPVISKIVKLAAPFLFWATVKLVVVGAQQMVGSRRIGHMPAGKIRRNNRLLLDLKTIGFV